MIGLGFVLLLLAALPAQAHNGRIALVYPVQDITVDGDLSDWPEGLPRYAIASRPYSAASLVNISSVQDEEDFSAFFRAAYNAEENALYIAVEVRDQSAIIAETQYRPGTHDMGVIALDPHHGRAHAAPKAYLISGASSNVSPAQVQVVSRQDSTWHYYEWRFDLGQIDQELPPLRPGMVIGFDTGVGDVDADTSTSLLYWGPEGQPAHETTTRLGDLVLLGNRADTGVLAGHIRWPDGSDAGRIKVEVQAVDPPVSWLQIKTDRAGRFSMPLPPGPYRVRALRQEQEVEVSAGKTSSLELKGHAALGQSVVAGAGKTVRAGAGLRRGKWRSWDASDELIDETIMAILQDREGVMWFGTGWRTPGAATGLVRYDGERYTTFAAEDGFTAGNITALAEDRAGHLWIGADKGLVRYDGEHFTTFTVEDGLPANWVLSLLVRQDGSLWVGTVGGVALYDGEHFANFTEEDGLPASPVLDLAEDRDGQLWLAASGLARYDGQVWQAVADGGDLVSNDFTDLEIDAQGRIWICAVDGVLRYDGDQWQTILTDSIRTFGGRKSGWTAAVEDDLGRLWLVSKGGGIKRLDGESWTYFDAGDTAVGEQIMTAYKDREGRVWFASKGGGIGYYDENFSRTYTTAEGLPHNVVFSALEDRAGRIWFATGAGLAHLENGEIVRDLPELTRSIWSVQEDRQGDLWLATMGDGVVQYDGSEAVYHTVAEGLIHNYTWSILPDSQGRIWVCFYGNTSELSRYDGERWQTFTAEDGIGLRPKNMVEDRAQQIWFGTGSGLTRFDGEHFTTFTRDDGLPGDEVGAMAVDSVGDLWFGFWERGGFARYRSSSQSDNGPRFDVYDVEGDYTAGKLLAMTVDDRGHLWLGSWGGGVTRYDGLVYQKLRRERGIPNSSIQKIMQARDGSMWISHEGGVTRYVPRRIAPAIELRNVVTDQPHGPVAEVDLPSTQDYLLFEFQGISLNTAPEDFVYVYRLEGYQDEWRQVNAPRVEFRDLPVGEYVFAVKAVDHDLNYSEPVAVAVNVYPQMVSSSVAIADVALDDVFASFYRSYAEQPFGTVVVANHNQEAVETRLRFFVPGLMRRPLDQSLVLAPQSSQEVLLTAVLEPSMLDIKDDQLLSAEVSLAFSSGDETISVQKERDIQIYGRGALQWDDVARAAAFVTAGDAQVVAFARQSLVAFENEIQARGQPLANLTRALVLFEALKAHGLRYLADANSPYAQATSDRSVIDYIQYPAELLKSKSGDCDDLTVLYASLLENAGVPTALVDYPGHIFLLFDTGVARQEAYKLPMEARLYVVRGDRVWIPVEITRLDQPFAEAWKQGLDELARLSERDRRRLVVDTAVAWERFAPVSPVFAGAVDVPERSVYAEALTGQHDGLVQQVDQYIEDHYIDVLEREPDNEVLRSELGRIYVALRQYDTAIKSAYNYLRSPGGERASTYNHLGILHYFKGELEQAAFLLQQALKLAPEDAGIRRNLEKVRAELGEVEAGARTTAMVEVSGGGAKGVAVGEDEDSFYWVE